MSLRRYESYRDSGVEWLGEVPSHWQVEPIRALALPGRRSFVDGDWIEAPFITDEGVRLIQTGNIGIGRYKEQGYRYVSEQTFRDLQCTEILPGDVLVCRLAEPVGRACLAPDLGCRMITSVDVCILKPRASLCPSFLAYFLSCPEYLGYMEGQCRGGTRDRVSRTFLGNVRVSLPPPSEQAVIAAFLDRETAKIDGLVAEQQRLIERLKEKRQAVIAHAVTKGLDPSAPMKDSDVEWLGAIPAHWEAVQSRRLFAVRNEPAHATDRMLTASQKYGVVYQADFVELEGRRVVEVIMGKDSLRHVEPDDFIISMRSFQGGLEWSRLKGSTSFHYVMVTPIKWVYPAFFAHLFKSAPYIQALRATTDLIRDGQEIRYSHFVRVPLPVIPLEEQKRIAEFLTAETGRYDTLLAESERFIAVLQERRSALISAAVTGRIDVRAAEFSAGAEAA